MLSVASVKSASGAASYFAKDDYHAAEYYAGEHATEMSAWGGEGARELGLSGEVSKEAFEKILNGIQPNGDAVGQVDKRQSGVDLTFSMSKSASVMAYVAGDERVLKAHWTAVSATMKWVEKNFAEGRTYERTKSGEPVRTGNLVYALFQHDTSRALDPQGHIHVVIANMTRMADGAWRALHNGQLWKNNSTIGAAYNAQFRAELAKLGYETEITGKHGQFEIRGVPKEVIDEFSQRRAQILAKAEQLGFSSTEALRSITGKTRDPKLNVEDRTSLRESWRERAAALGFDGKALIANAMERAGRGQGDERIGSRGRLDEILSGVRDAVGSLLGPKDPLISRGIERLGMTAADYRTQHAVASAVRILEQREAAFPVPQVSKTALDLGLAGVTAEKVDQRISELIRQDKLIPGKSERIDMAVTHVTTPDALATEGKILTEIADGKGAAKPIVPADQVVLRLTDASGDKQLNAGQLAAATLALSSTDRIVAVQGVAGAGKSTMIASVARVAEAEGRKVLGLAFQNKMVGDLKEGAGIEAQTVSSFVNTYARHALAGRGEGYEGARNALKGTVLVLDEASMVGSTPMRHLVGIANALGVDRLVMIGDRQQLSAIDAGKSFALAQEGGIALARMDENLRQRTDQLRDVAALANRGAVREALGVLGDNFKVTPGHVGAAADQWLGLSPGERDATALFASGRAARAELNTRVQEGLKADGTLSGEGRTLTVLERVNTTHEELRYPQIYQAGQTLEVARAVREIGLRPGSYAVLGVDANGRVQLQVGGRTVHFDPQKINPLDKRDPMGLAQSEQIKLHEGDKIRWMQNDKQRGLDNAALARVVSVGPKGITVEAADKTLHELKNGDPMLERLGLAYALNMHMAQGITADKGIAVMSSNESNLSNQRLFNVTVTRVRDDLTLYTDNKDKLTAAIERNEGNKTSALETIGKIDVDGPAAGKGGTSPTTPAPPPPAMDLSKPSMDLTKLRAPVEPRAPDLPFPEKDIGLEL
ncbi:MobF family relaxase [Croceicoccus marinus]|uniref:Conjugative relaxase n=1 Tax=Croceicoccus marinus TaxID=450378 RepID=A0A7G6W145_9SPHN|nr:MobF family relaxase [Croceicoccus marinus]QNE07710.1 conjugative relaxase [Croceicoccus marinus]